MGITIHYKAEVDCEEKVDRITNHFDRPEYSRKLVDFELEPRWWKSGYTYQPDYDENWEKYSLCSFADIIKDDYDGNLPSRFKGLVISLDEGCEPFWLTFGKYPDTWICRHFTKTQYAEKGFATHARLIDLLHELEPMVDRLEVYDEAGLWETGDIEQAARNFGQSEVMIRALGDLLKGMASKYGLTVETGYERLDNRKEGKEE